MSIPCLILKLQGQKYQLRVESLGKLTTMELLQTVGAPPVSDNRQLKTPI